MAQREQLTIREAATRVGRTPRTITRWLEDGLDSHLSGGKKHVWLDDLQAEFVRRLESNPARPQAAEHLEHGSPQRYWNGCRCDPCRAGHAAHARARYAQRVQETAERRARAAGWVGEPTIKAVPRPYRRRTQEAA